MADLARRSEEVKSQMDALTMFEKLRAGSDVCKIQHDDERYARRFRTVLQALDGFLADASFREIGEALFGATRIAADWDGRRNF